MGWSTTHGQWRYERGLARSMRNQPTPAEHALWQGLKRRRLGGMRFLRQFAIGRFIVDFYCAEEKLVIEVDGGVHHDGAERDEQRTRILETFGLRVLRFTNDAVLGDTSEVLARILAVAVRSSRR
jgi:very-short-patch-repair endonuclease